LRDFQDNEKAMPTILTTSQKLSTGVDARNIRNIVLMRPINSMIEFKQIIGRGTRLYDGKDYFTIYDFVKAHHHFNDEEWDGEPVAPEPEVLCTVCGVSPCVCVWYRRRNLVRSAGSGLACVRAPSAGSGRVYAASGCG
jgi:type I restriction enzyme R subunit